MLLSAEFVKATVRGVNSYVVPSYYGSRVSPLAAARKLSKLCKDITYTQVCRNIKTIAVAKKLISAVAKIRNVKSILAVTGDKASGSDISVFNLIGSIDKKRFNIAAAIVFTRNSEAQRIAKKAAVGATIFYTQPVFPGNSHKLAAVLKKLPPSKTKCEVKIGVLVPFSAFVCSKIAKEKPDFISDSEFIKKLAAAERKSAEAAFAATAELAKENLTAAIKAAEAVNSSKESNFRVTGIHFYGLTNRVFGTGKQKIAVTAADLLERVVSKPKRHRTAQKT